MIRCSGLIAGTFDETLRKIAKRKPIIENRVVPEIEQAMVQLALYQPAWSQVRISNELHKKSLFVSPGELRSVWLRHDLQIFKLRLKDTLAGVLSGDLPQENLPQP